MADEKSSTPKPYSEFIRGFADVQGRFDLWASRNEKAAAASRLFAHVLRSGTTAGLTHSAEVLEFAVSNTKHDGHDGTNHQPSEHAQLEYPAIDALVAFRCSLEAWIQSGGSDPRAQALVRLLKVVPFVALSSRQLAKMHLEEALEVLQKYK